MKSFAFSVLLIVFTVPSLHGYKVKHPQELDISSFEDDINEDLMKWTSKKYSAVDCSLYYRRIVKHLFDKKRFKADPASDYFIANVPLRLKKEQWDLLVDNNIDGLNMNEVDDILVEVLKQSHDADWDFPVSQILFEHYRQQLIVSLPSLDSPAFLITVALLVIIITCRFFNFSRLTFSAVILLMLLGICCVSYSMTYYDCLSDLEVERMIQLSKQQSINNPCKDYHGEQASFWSSMHATLFGSSENKCLEHMRKTFKTSKKYCDPLDVFAKWFGKIQMSYLSQVIGGLMELVVNISAASNILTRTIFWAIAAAAFVYIFLSFGKTVIISSFSGMFDMIKTTKIAPQPKQDAPDIRALSDKMDKILFENQQMKRELSVIRECSVERKIKEREKLEDINEESPGKKS